MEHCRPDINLMKGSHLMHPGERRERRGRRGWVSLDYFLQIISVPPEAQSGSESGEDKETSDLSGVQ